MLTNSYLKVRASTCWPRVIARHGFVCSWVVNTTLANLQNISQKQCLCNLMFESSGICRLCRTKMTVSLVRVLRSCENTRLQNTHYMYIWCINWICVLICHISNSFALGGISHSLAFVCINFNKINNVLGDFEMPIELMITETSCGCIQRHRTLLCSYHCHCVINTTVTVTRNSKRLSRWHYLWGVWMNTTVPSLRCIIADSVWYSKFQRRCPQT